MQNDNNKMEIKTREDLKRVCEERIEAIRDRIPSNYLNRIISKDPNIKASKIMGVRYGSQFDLNIVEMLEELVKEDEKNINS